MVAAQGGWSQTQPTLFKTHSEALRRDTEHRRTRYKAVFSKLHRLKIRTRLTLRCSGHTFLTDLLQ
jgi:hypothetical protein